MLSGANSWTEIKLFGEYHLDWLRKYRSFEHGIPVDDTIVRIIKRIEPKLILSARIRVMHFCRVNISKPYFADLFECGGFYNLLLIP